MLLKELTGKEFENEARLEDEVKGILTTLFKVMYPSRKGFLVVTRYGSIIELVTTSTIGNLTVLEVN